MKKILMLIAAVIVMAAPAFAQSAFSDVPSDHWAYGAVSQLEQSGMVIGYPDGEFKGKRNLTRYEFAMIVAKLLPFLKDSDIKVDSFVTKSELNGYVKKGEFGLDGYAKTADLEIIAKLANEFKAELAQLGVDVNALNADVNALKTKVAALEAEQQRVVITGDFNIMGKDAEGVSTDVSGLDGDIDYDKNVMDYNGRIVKGGTKAASLYKDFQLDIKGRVSNNITAYMTLVAGDYLQRMNGGSSNITLIPYYLYASMDWDKWGQMNLGEMPFQINKYVYQRYNDNMYFNVKRLTSGNYQVSGIDYAKDFGPVDLKAWYVRPQYANWYDQTYDINGYYDLYNVTRAYGMGGQIADMTGLNVGIDIATAKLDLLYNYTNTANAGAYTADTSNVWGATLNIPFGSVAFDTAYYSQKAKDTDRASLFDANLGLDWNGLKVGVGYLDVSKYYFAPANYEGFAYYINPDNIKGWKANASYQWGNFYIGLMYKGYKAKDSGVDPRLTAYGIQDKLNYGKIDLNYNTGSWGIFGFRYENVKADDAKKNYYTLDWKKNCGNYNFGLGIQRVENKDGSFNVDYKNSGTILYGQAGYSF